MNTVKVKKHIYADYVNQAYVKWKRAQHLGIEMDFEPVKRSTLEPIVDNFAIYDGGYFHSLDK